MNARTTRPALAALLATALLICPDRPSAAAPPDAALDQTAQPGQTPAAGLLRPAAMRTAPRKLDVNLPEQASFETGAVRQADVSRDGKWLVLTRVSGGYSELWLRSLVTGVPVLPRRLAPALADRLSPALSPDGRQLAFVGLEDDIKGDIYLLDLGTPDASLRRLTDRDTEDGAPAFSADGKTLYFHQRLPGHGDRRIVALALDARKASPRVLDTGGDASNPAPSPDGKRLAFVSTRSGASAVHLMDLPGGPARKLTSGAENESAPRFTPDGSRILFVVSPADASGKLSPFIAQAPSRPGSSASQLTSAGHAADSPIMTADRLYFLSERGGPSNVWSLPPEGEIPDRPSEELLGLADTLANQLPVDRALTILGYARSAQTAGAAAHLAAVALYSQGRQYEILGLDAQAKTSHEDAAQLGKQPHSGLARVRLALLAAKAERRKAVNDAGRAQALHKAQQALDAIANESGADARVRCQAKLELARLLMERGMDSASLTGSLQLLDALLAAPGCDREQQAEALFLKAETYAKIGHIQAVLPLYAQVISQHPEEGSWADLAVSRVLDRSLAGAGERFEDKAQALTLLSEQYRQSLPKLSLGALNRLGDVYFAADERARAKDAYRQCIARAKSVPQAGTQLAAARMALAEILYLEERFHQALDLYETEMAARPFEDRLYRLAKTAHLRKSVAAGDYLLRVGEVSSAQAIFAGLLRDDPSFVPAHRGMIRASAALRTIPATVAEYRTRLAQQPDDATLLYATGLALTYQDGKAPLLEARSLIVRAIQRNGQMEYFHQTLGYVDEVLETVHKERGRLESALESYRRARFLNAREQNPENAANLDLNIGNAHFLLGQYADAFEEYQKRHDSGVPFDNEETEILFLQRFGASAFQVREPEKPILAYTQSLELVEQRIQPKFASEIFGRIGRYVFDRVLTPALGQENLAETAKKLATRQSDLNNRLFEASTAPAGPPPDPAWARYASAIQGLLSEQDAIIRELPPLMPGQADTHMLNLKVMTNKVREALGFPPRFVELRAELHDRLGLALQETGRWKEARESFEKALAMNTALGLNRNLAANQRSVAYNAFMEAGLTTGLERDRLLDAAEAGFRRVPELVARHGVVGKRGGGRGKGLVNLDFDVTLDATTASQAAYGFSAEQELRLADTFLARIAAEQGRPREALGLVERQSKSFERGDIAPRDAFGAALLLHRAGLLETGLGREAAAFERFRRSAQLALELGNVVSASLNAADMAAVQAALPVDERFAQRMDQLRSLEGLVRRSLRSAPPSGESLAVPVFHNLMAAHGMALAERFDLAPGADPAQIAALRMDTLARVGQRLADGLEWFRAHPPTDRRAVAVNAALRLNEAALALRLGETGRRAQAFEAALALAECGLLPGVRWRALAGLGHLDEALSTLEALPLDEPTCGPGEVMRTFAPKVDALIRTGKAEAAFNLLERLSELERVSRMGALGGAAPAEAERGLLRRCGTRLLAIRDLTDRLSAVRDQERADISRRLEQEREILAAELGPERERLPGVARAGQGEAEQDWLLMLHGLSAELSATAASVVSTTDAHSATALRQRHTALAARLTALKAEAVRDMGRQDAPGALGFALPAPVEAMDLMDALPKGTHALRVALLPDGGWAALRLDADSVRVLPLPNGPVPVLPPPAPGEKRLLLFEEPTVLADEDISHAVSLGLSGTHMRRSLASRKPFRTNLLFVSGAYAAPKPFTATNAQASQPELAVLAAQAHTVVATPPVRQLHRAPSRQNEQATEFLALNDPKAEPVGLAALAASLRETSLAVLAHPEAQDLPLIAQLLSLYGVPSVLAAPPASAPGETTRRMESFLTAYAETTAADASGRTGAPRWLLLGDPGLSVQEAEAFAVTQFARYVHSGMEAFKSGRSAEALARFENALRVARSSGQFAKHMPDLLAYSRESAYGAGEYDKSLAYARELAVLLAKIQPDTPAHAEALLRLGLVEARLERYPAAITAMEQAAEMLANLELTPKEIEALSSLGAVLENAVQYDKALARFEGAAKLSRKAGTKELVARQYMSIGRIHDMRLSQYAQARAAYGEALRIYTELGKRADMAQAQLDMGRSARLTGDFPEADRRYAEALKLAGTGKDQERLRLRIVIEQANNAWSQARYQEAFDLVRAVLSSAETHGWALEQVIARNTTGLLWWSLGDHERAIRELDAALPLARSLRIRKDEVATTLNNRGLVERDMGRPEKALKTLNEALDIDREIRSRWAIAYDLRNIAQTYARMGDPKKALPLLGEALDIVSQTGNRVNQAKIVLAQGEALLATGDADSAFRAFSQADALARDMNLRDSRWRALHGLARIAMSARRLPEARALLEQAVTVIEDMRAELKVDQLKDGFIADKAVAYEDLVTVLADLGEVAESFRTAERSRARNLMDLLGNARRNPQRPEDKPLYERMNALRRKLHDQETLLAGAQAQAERAVYERGVKRAQDEYRDALLDLQARRPDLASLVSVNPLRLGEVQKLLEPGVGLLTYYVTADEVFCWTVDSGRAELVRTRLGRETLGRMVLTYRRMLQNLEPSDAHSKELYDLLVAPALPKLAGVRTLGIVPHDALHTLSFASLGNGEEHLLDRHALFQLPSASVFRFTVARRNDARNIRVLAVGNPDLRDSSLDLPFAEREVEQMAWTYPDMTALVGEKATKQWLTRHIGEFGIIHLATHGEFDPANPLFSALKLAGVKNDNGDLEAGEVFDLDINADLVVLSACQTGLGKVTSGDEVQGLNQAFLYAGTHALVSSLWRVSDIATAMLMKQFYREYQQRPKAESLRRAMLHVRTRFPHPGYWSAFTLTGDYK